MTHSHNVTIVIQTPIGEVHAECRVTPAERERFTGGMPVVDPPDPGEAEIVGDVWLNGWSCGDEAERIYIEDPTAILFWTPRVTKRDWSEFLGKWLIQVSTDRRDINNYTSLEAMILDKAMEEA